MSNDEWWHEKKFKMKIADTFVCLIELIKIDEMITMKENMHRIYSFNDLEKIKKLKKEKNVHISWNECHPKSKYI